jgi:hypothetical protein
MLNRPAVEGKYVPDYYEKQETCFACLAADMLGLWAC